MHPISAADLTRMIALARSGSGEELGKLLELYRGYLRLIVGLQIGEKLQAKVSPSDLIQATFLQATRGFADFHGNSEGELMSWLRKILASQLSMELRRYATERRNVQLERRIYTDVDQYSAVLSFLAAPGKTPSQSTIRRERAVLLADALTKLPDDYCDIIVQRHLQGRSFASIANRTNRSLDSVKSAWRRAIIKLRETLGDGVL